MTMYRSWIQAFCLLALAAMLPFQEGVEFLFCLIMAGLITWKVSAFAGTPPVRMPMTSAPANDTFTRHFPLTVSAACTSQYAAILSPGMTMNSLCRTACLPAGNTNRTPWQPDWSRNPAAAGSMCRNAVLAMCLRNCSLWPAAGWRTTGSFPPVFPFMEDLTGNTREMRLWTATVPGMCR